MVIALFCSRLFISLNVSKQKEMTYENFLPFTDQTNYDDVLEVVKLMYSDLNAQGDCCKNSGIKDAIAKVNIQLTNAAYDKEVGNEDRYKSDVQAAYLILKSFFRLSDTPDVSPSVPFTSDILAEVERGKDYLSKLNTELLSDLKSGCTDCMPRGLDCLYTTLNALSFKVDSDTYDEVAEKNLEIMLKIIGDYQVETPPTVDAGLNQSVEVGDVATFIAQITQGTYPIQSILWTMVSGTASLSGETTDTVQVSGFGAGQVVLMVTVTDTQSNVSTDTVTLTGIADDDVIAYWGVKANTGTLTRDQILAGNQVVYNAGSSFTVPYNMTEAGIVWFAYLATEPTKNYYQDTLNALNKGWMLSDQDYIGAPVTVSEFKYQESYYPLTQENPLKFSTQSV